MRIASRSAKLLSTISDECMQTEIYAWTFFALLLLIIATAFKRKKILANVRSFDKWNGYPVLDLSKMSAQIIFFLLCGIIIMMVGYGNTAFIYGNF